MSCTVALPTPTAAATRDIDRPCSSLSIRKRVILCMSVLLIARHPLPPWSMEERVPEPMTENRPSPARRPWSQEPPPEHETPVRRQHRTSVRMFLELPFGCRWNHRSDALGTIVRMLWNHRSDNSGITVRIPLEFAGRTPTSFCPSRPVAVCLLTIQAVMLPHMSSLPG